MNDSSIPWTTTTSWSSTPFNFQHALIIPGNVVSQTIASVLIASHLGPPATFQKNFICLRIELVHDLGEGFC